MFIATEIEFSQVHKLPLYAKCCRCIESWTVEAGAGGEKHQYLCFLDDSSPKFAQKCDIPIVRSGYFLQDALFFRHLLGIRWLLPVWMQIFLHESKEPTV